MTKFRSLAIAVALLALATVAPASAQAGPPDRSGTTVSTNGYYWGG
jgi:hypothetical protein